MARDPQIITAYDYDANGNVIYMGKTGAGAAKSVAAWQIKKLTYDANNNLTDVKYADGNSDYDNIWDNRATLSYS